MKKKFSLLMAIALISLLFACHSVDVDKDDDTDAEATFTGVIEEINGQSALVSINEGDILKSGGSVHIDLSVNSQETFQVGDKVKVGYDGEVRESFPLQVNTIYIEKIK